MCRSGFGERGGGERIEEMIASGTQYGMSNDLGTAPLVFEPQVRAEHWWVFQFDSLERVAFTSGDFAPSVLHSTLEVFVGSI